MTEKIPFALINKEIDKLISTLSRKGICPCCVAQGLMYRGAHLLEDVVSSDEAVATLQDIAESIGECDDETVLPTGSTAH